MSRSIRSECHTECKFADLSKKRPEQIQREDRHVRIAISIVRGVPVGHIDIVQDFRPLPIEILDRVATGVLNGIWEGGEHAQATGRIPRQMILATSEWSVTPHP